MTELLQTGEAHVTEIIRDDHGGPLASCLVMLSAHYGRPVSRDTLLAGLPLENGYLTPSNLPRAAERAGLAVRFARKPLKGLNTLLFPALLILREQQACLVISMDPKEETVTTLFPEAGDGEVVLKIGDLEERYTGMAAYVRPRFRLDERAPEDPGTKRDHWFWSAIRENRHLYKDVIIASALSNTFALAMPLFVMNVYNRVIPNRALESLWVLTIGVFIMFTADFALSLARSRLVDKGAARTNIRLSGRLMEQVLGMQLKERPPSVGSFASSVQGYESVKNFISSFTVTAYVDLPFAMFFLIIIGLIGWQLTLPILVGGAVILAHAVSIQREMRELSDTVNRANAIKNATLVESLVGIESLKNLGAEGHIQGRWEKVVAFLESAGLRLRFLTASVVSGTQWVQMSVSVAVMVVGVYLTMSNAMTMGGLIAAYILSSRAMAPIARAAALLMQYNSASRSLAALEEIMQKPRERPEGASYTGGHVFRGGIEMIDVSFSYPGQERPLLNGVSFRVEPRERVALIGRVGSGKTTLSRLIMGLYQPQSGSILVDGIDIRQIDPAELRRHIGIAPQDAMLFFGSLKNNLLLGNPPVSDVELLNAIRIGGVDSFAHLHPSGLDMPVGERGELLSTGQRQSVLIARAVLKNPAILLMDEPTASMDSATEERVRRNLAAFSQGRTLLVITHKTALLELVDRIIVLEGGRIVADGSKEAVLRALQQGPARDKK